MCSGFLGTHAELIRRYRQRTLARAAIFCRLCLRELSQIAPVNYVIWPRWLPPGSPFTTGAVDQRPDCCHQRGQGAFSITEAAVSCGIWHGVRALTASLRPVRARRERPCYRTSVRSIGALTAQLQRASQGAFLSRNSARQV